MFVFIEKNGHFWTELALIQVGQFYKLKSSDEFGI